MKSFLDHLKEEVLPTVQVADGGLDISKPAVRAAINAAIAGVVSQPAVTPYVVFNRLSKLLAQYHIVLPKRFLEGDKGVEVFELRQFGHKMGMTDSGEFVNEVPSTHYLFLQYGILSPFGITYAKPVVGGMFKVMARIVDKEELDKLIDMAEITMAEEAEVNQAIAKANAPRDPMHDITSDEKKKGNKEAVGASEKKSLDEGEVKRFVPTPPKRKVKVVGGNKEEIEQQRKKLDAYHKARHNKDINEDTLDEVSLGKLVRYKNKAGEGREKGLTLADKKMKGKAKVNASAPKNAYMEEDKDPCWKGYEMIGMKKKGGKPVPNCVPVKEEQIDEVSKRLLGRYIKKAHVSGLGAAAEGEQAYSSKDKEGLHRANKTGEKREQGIERAVNKMTGSARVSANEAYEKQEAGVKTKDGKTHTLHRRNPGHSTEYHTVTTKDAEGKTTVKAGKPKYIKKHWDKLEETQIDEISTKLARSYVAKAKEDGKGGRAQGVFRAIGKMTGQSYEKVDKNHGNVTVGHLKPKVLTKEESLDEKAPPGAKFERMVKHIKKGYAKDGELTKKEKGIAFATAWKAKNREKGE